jgi:branched-chain amino acid transport system substrate-binding protein
MTTNRGTINNLIKIGSILPLTGGAAQYGQWIKKGLELGKEEINKSGGINGKNLEIIYFDDQATPELSVLGMKELTEQKNVPLIFGSWASSCVLAQAPIAQQTRTVVMAEAVSPKIQQAGEYIFNIQPDARYYLKKLVPFVYNDLNIKNIFILAVENDFGLDQAETFKAYFESIGGRITNFQSFKSGAGEFKKEVLEIKKNKPEAVFIPAYTEIVSFVKQLKKSGLNNIRIIASIPFENPEIITQLKNDADNIVYPYHYAPSNLNAMNTEFRKEYFQKNNEEPEGFAALAYDGIKIIAEVLKRVSLLAQIQGKKELDGDSIRKELHNIYHYGVTGEIVFKESGYPIKKIVIKTVKDGQFIEYSQMIEEEAGVAEQIGMCPPDY